MTKHYQFVETLHLPDGTTREIHRCLFFDASSVEDAMAKVLATIRPIHPSATIAASGRDISVYTYPDGTARTWHLMER